MQVVENDLYHQVLKTVYGHFYDLAHSLLRQFEQDEKEDRRFLFAEDVAKALMWARGLIRSGLQE